MNEIKQTSLKEAAEEYAYRGVHDELKPLMKPLADEIIRNFIAGAKWQAEKCDEETSKLLYAERQTAYINGWHDCKEQMLKDVVEGEVENSCFGIVYLRKNLMNEGYSTGDKVKILILKDEE